MKDDKNKKELKRASFDYYIWQCFMDFLDEEGNYIKTENGKRLKDGKEFQWIDSPNRNNKQVPNELWRAVLYCHLKEYNQN
jgi:hypothetical protein